MEPTLTDDNAASLGIDIVSDDSMATLFLLTCADYGTDAPISMLAFNACVEAEIRFTYPHVGRAWRQTHN